MTNHAQHDGSVSQPYQYVGQLGYYTHVQDANLPLLQLGVRMYDPEIGRFTQADPAWGTANSYWYADDQPAGWTDPSGLWCLKICHGKPPHRRCVCIGRGCHGDSACPPARRPADPKKKPYSPPPQTTLPPSYVVPSPAGEAAGCADPDAACGALALVIQKELARLEDQYTYGKITEEEYEKRKAELEAKLEGCGKYSDRYINQ